MRKIQGEQRWGNRTSWWVELVFVSIFKFQSLLLALHWNPEFEHLFCYSKLLVKWIAFVSLNCCVFANTFKENASRESFSWTQITVSISNSYWFICALCVMKEGAEAVEEIFQNIISYWFLYWARGLWFKLGAPKTVMNERDVICPLGFRSTEFFSARNCWGLIIHWHISTHSLIYFFSLQIPNHF